MRLIIAGSRGIKDYHGTMGRLNEILGRVDGQDEIVSGACPNSPDMWAEQMASEVPGTKVKYFPADWELHGKSAGFKRNVEMADYADAALIFWDGQSKGTKHMIDLMLERGKSVCVFRVKNV